MKYHAKVFKTKNFLKVKFTLIDEINKAAS